MKLPALLPTLAFVFTMTHAADYSPAIPKIEAVIREEMKAWQIGGLAIALVDDQQTVWAQGFGEAKRDSIFRAGSISKVFNAVGVMQAAEEGKLDLDAPLSAYGSRLVPVVPFPDAVPVTLRQLLCHRSGLQRESVIGGYLDLSQPGLAATVASVGSCVLVTPPNAKTRYSNLGPSIAGRALEVKTGTPFQEWQKPRIFDACGMKDSAWYLRDLPPGRLVPSWIRVSDGTGKWNRQRTPEFDLGTIPAGNLYTTVDDLARFAAMLAAGGKGANGRVLKEESLQEMWKPQLTDDEKAFGLGFARGQLGDERVVSHNGAVYGHSSSFIYLPDHKLAAIVMANEDIVNARTVRIAQAALWEMLSLKKGTPIPERPKLATLTEEQLSALAGDYESQSFWARLEVRDGRIEADISGQPTRLQATGPNRFIADSRLENATPVEFVRGKDGAVEGFSMGMQKFRRVPVKPDSLPAEWKVYLGKYGPEVIPIIIVEKHGHLYATTENMVDYRLTPVNRHVFALPPGMYLDEHLVVLTDAEGKPHALDFCNMILPRR